MSSWAEIFLLAMQPNTSSKRRHKPTVRMAGRNGVSFYPEGRCPTRTWGEGMLAHCKVVLPLRGGGVSGPWRGEPTCWHTGFADTHCTAREPSSVSQLVSRPRLPRAQRGSLFPQLGGTETQCSALVSQAEAQFLRGHGRAPTLQLNRLSTTSQEPLEKT